MVKNGENANLRRVPWVQIPDAQKIRKISKNHPRRAPDTSFGHEVVSHRCTRSARQLK